jgi:Tfp pilus assembly PilM family ATPase
MFWKKFFLTYFPTPRFLEMPFVGIDVSPMFVRIVEIPHGSALHVGVYEEKPLTNTFSLSGDTTEIKNILKEWKKKYHLHYVKISLPEENAYIFQKEMKFDTDDNMREAIEMIMEENVPVNGADSIFDYRLSDKGDNKSGLVNVAVTVLPVETIHKYIELFDECGLTPLSFMIEAQALSRAVIKKGDKETYLIIHIGSTRIGFFVTSKEAVQFTSSLSIQTEDKKEIIISDQIKKVLAYWHSKQGHENSWESIQKILLCGGGAVTPGLRESLARELNIPTEIGNVWVNLDSDRGYVPPITKEESLSYGFAIGLALPEKE